LATRFAIANPPQPTPSEMVIKDILCPSLHILQNELSMNLKAIKSC
jgi:hypothetical protein